MRAVAIGLSASLLTSPRLLNPSSLFKMPITLDTGGQVKEQIAIRLKQALERRKRSIRSFQQALRAKNVYGSSYASVYEYVQGRTTPPLEFLEAAAPELAVRLGWLVTGEGEITEAEEEAVRAIPSGAIPGVVYAPLSYLESYATRALLSAWAALAEVQPGPLGRVVDDGSERTVSSHTWHQLQRAVLEPLGRLTRAGLLGPVSETNNEVLSDYVAAVAMAIQRYTRAVTTDGKSAAS